MKQIFSSHVARLPNWGHRIVLVAALFGLVLVLGAFSSVPAAHAASVAPALAQTVPAEVVRQVTTTPEGQLVVEFIPNGSKQAAIPNSAFGCNQDVCISLVGSGAFVQQWNTFAFNSGPVCTRAFWELNNYIIVKNTNVICADQAGVFYAYWSPNRNFPTPSLACNWWLNLPGYPCETIHR